MTLLTTILQNDTVKVMVLDNTKTFVEYIKEPSSIIAFVAIVLSLFGIIFSVFYNRKTIDLSIKHTKLSIEPILNCIFRSIPTHFRIETFQFQTES